METNEILEVQNLLARKLSDDPGIMIEQLKELEPFSSRLIVLLAEAQSNLDAVLYHKLLKKAEKVTELDREVKMRAETAPERRLRDILKGLADSVHQRLVFGQSILKAHSSEINRFQP